MGSDRYRPAEYQIRNHYRCDSCQRTAEQEPYYATPTCCGSPMSSAGESYPGNSADWDEERNDNTGEWERRR